MLVRVIAVTGLAAALALAATHSAGAKRIRGAVRTGPAPYASPGYAFSGPYMIEVKPGLWISSWDCVTDEGQGRLKPCSTSGRR